MATSDISTTPDVEEVPEYNPALHDWNDLVSEGVAIQGATLLKEESLDGLVGVPFVITKIVFRKEVTGWYTSSEAVIAPDDEIRKLIKRGRLKEETMSVDPGETIVINDGSTGIYRQLVKYLHVMGYIVATTGDITENAPKGESTWDTGPDEWAENRTGYVTGSGEEAESVAFHTRLVCGRGIRKSEYSNKFTKEATTRYLA
jgi:hypothetical protein